MLTVADCGAANLVLYLTWIDLDNLSADELSDTGEEVRYSKTTT